MRQPARKITVQLPDAILEQMRRLIASGQAASQRALVEQALRAHFEALEDAWLRAEMAKAAQDPMFVADNAEIARDFAAADNEMLWRARGLMPLQWEIWQVALDPIVGHEQGGTRPGLVVSTDAVNETAQIITIVPLTSLKPGRRVYPTEVEVPADAAGQPRASLAMTHQARALDIERFRKRYGVLTSPEIRASVTQALRYTFRRAV